MIVLRYILGHSSHMVNCFQW